MGEHIGFRASEDMAKALDEIALERSEPGEPRVTRSDVARDAIDEYVEKHRPQQPAD